jgi:hypothetical protein
VTSAEFATKLGYYRQGGLQARNLYLWLAGAEALRAALGDQRTAWLAAPSLLSTEDGGEAAVRHGLEEALRDRLASHVGRRAVLVMTEPGALARYRVPLTLCYEYVSGSLVVVIAADPLPADRFALPRGLRLEAGKVIAYLRAGVDAGCVVEEAAL